VNRVDTVKQIVWLDQVAAAAAQEAAKLRDGLLAEAAEQYQEQGTIPTYRIPDLGTVSLSVSKESVYVADERQFADWVADRYPDEVVPKVRPAWQKQYLASLCTDDGIVSDDEGEIVPGLAVRPGGQPRYVSIRPSAEARDMYRVAATDGLHHIAEAGYHATAKPAEGEVTGDE
jgi:hypothetical protein